MFCLGEYWDQFFLKFISVLGNGEKTVVGWWRYLATFRLRRESKMILGINTMDFNMYEPWVSYSEKE